MKKGVRGIFLCRTDVSIDNIKEFTDQCFDRESEKAAGIIKGILDSRSPRISDISNAMEGNSDANYKPIQRFIDKNDPKEVLQRFYDADSSFVLGDNAVKRIWKDIMESVYSFFRRLVFGNVRNHV